ncbi:MAG: hypothetical protein ACOYD4_04050 [Solirubrobacterales bacterium]
MIPFFNRSATAELKLLDAALLKSECAFLEASKLFIGSGHRSKKWGRAAVKHAVRCDEIRHAISFLRSRQLSATLS